MSETPTAQAFTDHSLRLAQIANPQSEIVHFPAHEPLKLDYLWAGLCLLGAVYFIFRP